MARWMSDEEGTREEVVGKEGSSTLLTPRRKIAIVSSEVKPSEKEEFFLGMSIENRNISRRCGTRSGGAGRGGGGKRRRKKLRRIVYEEEEGEEEEEERGGEDGQRKRRRQRFWKRD